VDTGHRTGTEEGTGLGGGDRTGAGEAMSALTGSEGKDPCSDGQSAGAPRATLGATLGATL